MLGFHSTTPKLITRIVEIPVQESGTGILAPQCENFCRSLRPDRNADHFPFVGFGLLGITLATFFISLNLDR